MTKVRYSYLPQQFANAGEIFDRLRAFVPTGDFTLGAPVGEFEEKFAQLVGTRHAIGVGSGTDAIKLALKAVGVGPGDEVVTAANTFIATVGAVNELGAKPVFVDCDDRFCMDVDQVEGRISDRTTALLPVHLNGYMADMLKLMRIADTHGLPVVEDSCQAILADIGGKRSGTWGAAGCFSLHPLKNLNVWGDGGMIVTSDDAIADRLKLLRNHGLRDRDHAEILGYNSRLDSIQAIIGLWLIGQAQEICEKRIANAAYLDEGLGAIEGIRIPERPPDRGLVYHLYIVFAEDRDGLFSHCDSAGIECKVHYPIPLYRQKALAFLGHQAGDFPVADRHARDMITFPADEYLDRAALDHIVETVREFYGAGG